MTLEQMFESFIREKQYLDNRSLRTIKHYRAAFKTYRRFVQEAEVTQATINDFVVKARQAGMFPPGSDLQKSHFSSESCHEWASTPAKF